MSDPYTLFSLPLFPLGTVLYPDGLLPLRIFEVRYLDLIRKCHKNGAPFGVVCLTEGSEVQKAESLKSGGDGFAHEVFNAVGTLATITEFQASQPGLISIRCKGVQRFKIVKREKLKYGLWVADVSWLDADIAVKVPYDLQASANTLGKLIKSLQQRDVPIEQRPVGAPYRLDDCGWVANRWCELLPISLEMKQRLMELENPVVRLELVSDILEQTGLSL